MKLLWAGLSAGALAVSIAVPFVYFRGDLSEPAFKQILAWASLAWFVFATLWATRKRADR